MQKKRGVFKGKKEKREKKKQGRKGFGGGMAGGLIIPTLTNTLKN